MKNSITIGISSVLVAGLIFSTSLSFSAEEELLPSWIKNTAGFWADNQISDIEFMNAIEFLIGADIIKVPEAIAQEVPEAIAQEVPKAISQEVSEAIAQEVSEAIAQEVSEAISQEVSEAIAQEVSEAIAQVDATLPSPLFYVVKVENPVSYGGIGGFDILEVTCDAGDEVVSGGYVLVGKSIDTNISVPFKTSEDISYHDGWKWNFQNFEQAPERGVSLYAVCADTNH